MGKKRILIVDDEATIRLLLGQVFRQLGFEIESVENGEKALLQIARKTYDLIITDYMMPGMNGLELIRRIKTIKPSLPVLVVTSNGPEAELLKSGALACIKKPFNILEIKNISQNILDGSFPRASF